MLRHLFDEGKVRRSRWATRSGARSDAAAASSSPRCPRAAPRARSGDRDPFVRASRRGCLLTAGVGSCGTVPNASVAWELLLPRCAHGEGAGGHTVLAQQASGCDVSLTDVAPQRPGVPSDGALAALVPLAAAGDEAAFTRLVAACHADMARVAYVVSGGDREIAQDAVQSAWAIAWSRLRMLRDPERVRAWLLSVAANEARQALRRGRRVVVIGLDEVSERAGADDPDGDARDLDVRAILARLKPEERTLLGLRYAAGLDSAEIGAVMGISASGVRSRLERLLDRLRTEMRDG